jgi:WXG100 family type VII secretion target
MSASDEVAGLPGGQALAALAAQVQVKPGTIRDIAKRWSRAAADCQVHSASVNNAVSEVGQDWKGTSAEAFAAFMGGFSDAGSDARQALNAAAQTLDEVAGALEEANVSVERICENLLGEVTRLRADNPLATASELNGRISGLAAEAAAAARPKVAAAQQAIAKADAALSRNLAQLSGTFSALPQAGTLTFVPAGGKPLGWVPVGADPGHGSLAGGNGAAAPAGAGGTPASSGSGGAAASSGSGSPGSGGGPVYTTASISGGGSLGGPSAGCPAPPAQVNGWISQAVKILEAQGIPASKLSPQDIWIIIQHESGGNPNAINNYDINAQMGHPSIGLMQCVPLSTLILTRRGWLMHDEVRIGDETVGYNPANGWSEWTQVRKIVHYEHGEVWRIGNKHWHAEVTPNHRWWSDTRCVRKPETLSECPECGFASSPRGVSTHLGRMHGVRGLPALAYVGEFVRTDQLKADHRLRLAAPAMTGGIAALSLEEVRIIAWLQGDGHIRRVLAKPVLCPECGWRPGDARRRETDQQATAVAVHRAKKHGMTKDRTHGEPAGNDAAIFQSKPAHVVKLRALLFGVDHSEDVRHRGGNALPAHVFRLRRAYVTELVKRSGVMETGPEAFVLALSPGQRAVWLDSMIDAEGYRQPGAKPGHREFVRIAQVNGPLQDAIKLAVYLEGYRPTFSANSAERNGYRAAGVVGMAGPHVAPKMFNKPQTLERQPVYCVKTDLETWTACQDGQIFLTGNTIGPTFNSYALPGHGDIRNPVDNIIAGVRYALARYGSLDNVPGVAAVHHGQPYVGY